MSGPPTTLFRFRLKTRLNDLPIDVRVALHPSETRVFMVTRLLAYALNYGPGIEFSAGLAEPDAPAIRVIGPQGQIEKWIDIGNPSPKRMHKAAKAASEVLIYTYKDVSRLLKEAEGQKIYNSAKIKIYSFEPDYLETLVGELERDNIWTLTLQGLELEVEIKSEIYETQLRLSALR